MASGTARQARRRHRDRRGRVLVVSHEATRTGAPRIAVEVLGALEGAYERVVVLQRPGPLEGEFADASERLIVEPLPRVRNRLADHRATAWFGRIVEQVVALGVLARTRPDLVYLNTLACTAWVRPARWLRRPVVLHSHELEPHASAWVHPYRLGHLLDDVALVGCSEAARSTLAEIAGVPVDDVHLVLSTVDRDRVLSMAADGDGDGATDTPPPVDGQVVGACGTANLRKGIDLWVDVARGVRTRRPDVRFEWLGDLSPEAPSELPEGAALTGPAANPYRVMAAWDLFVLTSRADAYPLVVLESMTLGIPVVAFRVGGVPDQLGDAGVLVDELDVDGMVDAVVALLDDPADRGRRADLGRIRVDERFSVERLHDDVRALVAASIPTA